jgi:aspartyl-tRNA(Asn)/glutamyl-tRNA(Gln) amidotransferase subunit A
MLKEYAKQLRSGAITSRALTEAALSRMEETEPSFHAFITVCADVALAAAEGADARIAAGEAPLLCGIPMALKDNICTAGIRTTCASRMLEDFVPPYDAYAWERLRAEGAVLLGKTNLDEFAMGSGNETSAFGVCRNPINPDYVAGGSSGGSAAAVAAGDAVYALGSDTGGSVRVPAAYCGVVGVKPTYGRISRRGLIAMASSLDQIGIMTKTVEDSALVLAAISGRDPMEPTSADRAIDFLEEMPDVRGMRVGICDISGDGVSAAVQAMYARATAALTAMGATVVPVSMPSSEEAYAAYYLISACEASSNLARYDGIRYGRAGAGDTLEEMFASARSHFGDEVKRRLLAGTYALAAQGRGETYDRARLMRTRIRTHMKEQLQSVDVILTPTAADTAYPVGGHAGDAVAYRTCDMFITVPSLAGLPAISVPAGRDRGLPLGMQIVAPHFREDILYRAALAMEEALGYEI